MKYLFLFLLASPALLMAQQDSMFYNTGELMNVSFYHESGNKKSRSYYYKTGELKGENFYDRRGVLSDGYTLGTEGDTIGKSFVPLFNAQAKKDLSFIDWKTDESGISIMVEEKGSGKKLTKGDQVEVWYIGYFEDGSQFDNSDITATKIRFTLGEGRMLKSFEDALLKFRSGSAGYIRIPYHLGYGDRVMGNLPAKSDLIYYIRPIRVKPSN